MSKVSIKVGPKTYTFNTAEGDEAKITALGEVIDSKYQMLGHTRSVQETDNLVFAALFLADELEEARAEAARLRAQAGSEVAKSESVNDDLNAEIDTLREAEQSARQEVEALKAEIARLNEASRQQHELFAGSAPDDGFAEKLEALADRAEQIATALETAGLEGEASAD